MSDYKMGTTISFGFPTSTTPRIIMALATTTNRPVPLLANPLPAPEQSSPQKEPAVVERSYLPETWLWQIISLNRSMSTMIFLFILSFCSFYHKAFFHNTMVSLHYLSATMVYKNEIILCMLLNVCSALNFFEN